jgi:YHS domain-containing protein
MAQCPICGANVDEAAVRASTSQTAFGAAEVDPSKGTRQFHDGKWYYFDTLECRQKFMAQQSGAGTHN